MPIPSTSPGMSLDGFSCALRLQKLQMGFGRGGLEDYREHSVECTGDVVVAGINNLKLKGLAEPVFVRGEPPKTWKTQQPPAIYSSLREALPTSARPCARRTRKRLETNQRDGWSVGIFTQPNKDGKSTLLYIARIHFSIERETQ
jgi:hypothetical protein